MTTSLSPELLTLIGVAIALAGLIINGQRSMNARINELREDLRDLGQRVGNLVERFDHLGQRVARIEGMIESNFHQSPSDRGFPPGRGPRVVPPAESAHQ